jgi:hypothetical protein
METMGQELKSQSIENQTRFTKEKTYSMKQTMELEVVE